MIKKLIGTNVQDQRFEKLQLPLIEVGVCLKAEVIEYFTLGIKKDTCFTY